MIKEQRDAMPILQMMETTFYEANLSLNLFLLESRTETKYDSSKWGKERDLRIRIQKEVSEKYDPCLLYTSPSPRDRTRSRMPSSA